MAVILVGAMLVAGIETLWKKHYPPATRAVESFSEQPIILERADELGRFKFGSTVVLLFSESITFDKQLAHGDKISMGERLSLA